MTTQAVGSVVRQGLAFLVSIYGVLTQTVGALHLPAAVSTVLVATGPLLFAIEHYVSDPSTGTPVTTTTTTTAIPAPTPVAVPLPVAVTAPEAAPAVGTATVVHSGP